MINRTGSYLNWRYLQKIGYHYYCFEIIDYKDKLNGFFVLKLFDDEYEKILHIIDFILPRNSELYQKVLNYVVKIALEHMATKISLIINTRLEFFDFLKRNGFFPQEKYFIPIVHLNNKNVEERKMNDINNYYFTMGDNDIF